MKIDSMPDCRKTCDVFMNALEMAEQIKTLQVENEKLKKAIAETLEDNAHLADGDICALIKLKTVMQDKESE